MKTGKEDNCSSDVFGRYLHDETVSCTLDNNVLCMLPCALSNYCILSHENDTGHICIACTGLIVNPCAAQSSKVVSIQLLPSSVNALRTLIPEMIMDF